MPFSMENCVWLIYDVNKMTKFINILITIVGTQMILFLFYFC